MDLYGMTAMGVLLALALGATGAVLILAGWLRDRWFARRVATGHSEFEQYMRAHRHMDQFDGPSTFGGRRSPNGSWTRGSNTRTGV
jgi:hypothetical protein